GWEPDAEHGGAAHWRAAVRAPRIPVLLAVGLLAGAATGAVNASATAFAEHTLGDRDLVGWLLAAWAGGAMIGGLTAAARRWTLPPRRRVAGVVVGFGGALAAPRGGASPRPGGAPAGPPGARLGARPPAHLALARA